jgi:parallel beta-helix repeat protein
MYHRRGLRLHKKLRVTIVLVLLVSIYLFSFNIPSARAITVNETIRIQSDGSITPSSAPITKNGNIYTLTSNISFPTNYDGIIIERDNVVLDGAGYSIKQNGQLDGVTLIGRYNVTIRNLVIKDFYWGIFLNHSSSCTITRNELTVAMYSIYLLDSSNNKIYHNNLITHRIYIYNSTNTWDDGYPSGGNYWSDYPASLDTNGDGIGEQPYELLSTTSNTNVDRYPRVNILVVSEFSNLLQNVAVLALLTVALVGIRRRSQRSNLPARAGL